MHGDNQHWPALVRQDQMRASLPLFDIALFAKKAEKLLSGGR